MELRWLFLAAAIVATGLNTAVMAQGEEEDGFVSLFNGKDLTGWKIPEGDNGHWKVVDGVIDYDASSEAAKDKNLWTEKSYGDFILKIDWRLKPAQEADQALYNAQVILPDGSPLKDATGKAITVKRFSPDSGLYLRGSSKAQVNIWGWPLGSGDFYGYRNNQKDDVIRAGVTPSMNADKPLGEWNRYEIYMIGDRVTILLNSQMIIANAQLPEIPAIGPIALQHHGGKNPDGTYKAASSLIQFKNIWIRELPTSVETPAR